MELDLYQKEEYKETELGLLPKDWEVVKLNNVVTTKKGRKPKTLLEDIKKGYLPYLTADHFRTKRAKQFASTKNESLITVDKEDVVFIWDGSNAGDVFTGLNGVLASTMIKISPKKESLLTRKILYYYLKTKFYQFNTQTTGSTIPHVNKNLFENLLIPLPPLSEQKKIAYVLSTVQEAKEKTEDVIKATKELKKSMMKYLFTYGPLNLEEAEKVTLKETEIGLIPEEWEMNTFGNVGTFQYGYTESANEKEVGPKFLRITDINLDTNIIKWDSVPYCKIEEDRFANYSLNEGDILIARIGATTGKTCIIKNPPKSVFASYLIRFIVNRDIIDPNFLFYYTQDYRYWRQINAGKEGKLKKGVSSSQLKKFLLPVPSLLTQKKIASILSAIDQKIEAEESKKKALEDLFKSLLHNLMTAKIRVNHLENVFDE
jgi:type I restriction enzyme S subunit